MKRTLAIVLAAAVAGGIAGGVIGLALDGGSSSAGPAPSSAAVPAAEVTPSRAPKRAGLTPEELYRSDAPAVVVITATSTQAVPPTLFMPPLKERVQSLGSGFVIDARGDVVTNDHVVQGASGIRVGFNSGASYVATVVGADPSTDVAVVRVKAPASALHPLAFDRSSAIEPGDPVYAIGNPFGLDRTMTAGIVSAIGRDIQAPNGLTIADAVQTDAPINHGNSGGPLLDRFDGLAVTNAIVRDDLATRVLLVSAFTDSGVVYKALETGAAGFLSKEARREQIVDSVLACSRGENVVSADIASGLVSEIRLRKRD